MATEIERCAMLVLAHMNVTRDELRRARDRMVNGETITSDEFDATNPETYRGWYTANTTEYTHDWAVMLRARATDEAAWGLMVCIDAARRDGPGELAEDVAEYARRMVDICANFYERLQDCN